MSSTFDGLGVVTGWSLVLVVLLGIGIPLAVRAEPDAWRRRAHLPLSLFVAALAFALSTGLGRGEFYAYPGGGADASRYVHVTAALVLPALALAASAIATRWRAWLVPMVLLFVVGIPLNVRDSARSTESSEAKYVTARDKLLVTAHLPILPNLPRSLKPDIRTGEDWVTVGWLVDGVESGRIPAPGEAPDVDRTEVLTELVLQAVQDDTAAARCQPLPREPMPLEVGQRLVARGPIVLDVEDPSSSLHGEVERYVLPGYALHVMADGLRVGAVRGEVQVCPVT
jgi:hypothetical protein